MKLIIISTLTFVTLLISACHNAPFCPNPALIAREVAKFDCNCEQIEYSGIHCPLTIIPHKERGLSSKCHCVSNSGRRNFTELRPLGNA